MRRASSLSLRTSGWCCLAALGCSSGSHVPPGLPVGTDSGTVPTDTAFVVTDGAVLPARVGSSYPGYDLTVVLPYRDPEQTFTLETQSLSARLDVHLNVDTTGSFRPEIQTIQSELLGVLVPGLRASVADLAMGVSRFADFPVPPYGQTTDQLYNLLTAVTTDFGRVNNAVGRFLPLQDGNDVPEGWDEALYQIATGSGFRANGVTYAQPFASVGAAPGGGTGGGVGFRPGSARVVITITDAPAHEPADYLPAIPGVHGTAAVGAALAGVGAHFIGIAADNDPRAQMEYLAMATGATVPPESGSCPTGLNGSPRPPVGGVCPLVFDILQDGTGLTATVVDAVARFLDHQAFADVHGEAGVDPHGFVQAIEALSATVPAGVAPPGREDRRPLGMPDGIPDTFTTVLTRTQTTFRVHLRNTGAPTQEYPQLFFVQITILGDGQLLASRTVRIVVPEGPKPDSGTDGSTPDATIPNDLGPAVPDAAPVD